MIEDLMRQVTRLQRQVDGLIKPEISIDLISPFLDLPGLVGFWPMSSVQRSTGNAYDLSGQGRTLTYTGNPAYNILNSRVPYIDLDGAGDYLSRNDETDLDITGTETIFAGAAQGFTMGGWFSSDDVTAEYGLIGKYLTTGNQRSYLLTIGSTSGAATFFVSGNGTATVTAVSAANLANGSWYFIVGRYATSTSVIVYVNGVAVSNTVGVPASLFQSTANFNIGAFNNGALGLLNGRATLCFLCANRLAPALIGSLFEQTRGAFRV